MEARAPENDVFDQALEDCAGCPQAFGARAPGNPECEPSAVLFFFTHTLGSPFFVPLQSLS